MTNEVIAYKHLCQMAGPRDQDADIFQGTSKSVEGFGAHACFTVLKEAGLHVEVHWQDGDSSSENLPYRLPRP